MSDGSVSASGRQGATEPVSFGERLAISGQFDRTFKDGMALVERAAAYLDSEGRNEARDLRPPVSLAYATESMRLTTRLLELASWLLIRRGLNSGELSPEQAASKRAPLKLSGSGRPSHIAHFDDLPATLKGLIVESFELRDRIKHLDRAIVGSGNFPANPVAQQIAQLEHAFTRKPAQTCSRLSPLRWGNC